MIIETNKIKLKEFSQDDVKDFINQLNDSKCEYLILRKSKYDFIQVANNEGNKFQIEISEQKNDGTELRQSIRDNFTLNEIKAFFIQYYRNDLTWTENLKWKTILIRNAYFLSDKARKICLIFGIILMVYFAIRINIPDRSLRNILGLKWYYYLTICCSLISLGTGHELKNLKNMEGINQVYTVGTWIATAILLVVSLLSLIGII